MSIVFTRRRTDAALPLKILADHFENITALQCLWGEMWDDPVM